MKVSPLLAKVLEKAREDVNLFIEFVFSVKQAKCHKDIQSHLLNNKRAGVIAHKELGKTTQALGHILWLIGNNPEIRIKLVCSADDAAKDRVMFFRDMIDRNERLHLVFPNLKKNKATENWGKFSLTVERKGFSKDATIEACGVLTHGEGSRADFILFDDVCDFQNTIKYPNLRKQVIQSFKTVWIPLLGPEGRAAYLATKHHEADLSTELETNTEWSWIDSSVVGDPPVSPWEEKWTSKKLIEREREIGRIEFDRSMRNILHPDSERIIKKDWIKTFRDSPKEEQRSRYISWDFAASAKQGDYTARAVIEGYPQEKIIRVQAVDRWKGLTYSEIVEKIWMEQNFWKAEQVLVEASGFQIIVGRDERLVGLPIKQVVPKVSKEQRVKMASVWFEQGRVLFMDGKCQVGIDELLAFPRATHDDCVDAIIQGVLRVIEMYAKDFRPEDSVACGSARVFRPDRMSSDGVGSIATSSEIRTGPNFRSQRW